MLRLHVFDLDGTLLDTKAATLQAYREAALEIGTHVSGDFEFIWGHTALEWGCTPQLHAAKVRHYAMLTHLIKPAWAAHEYRILLARLRNGDEDVVVRVLTGASRETVQILNRDPDLASYVRYSIAGLTLDMKVAALIGMQHVRPNADINYYDDDPLAVEFICSRVSGLIVHTPPKTKGATQCE